MSSYFEPQLFSLSTTSFVQWLCIGLLLLNINSLPLVWHVRVFWRAIIIRLRWLSVFFYHPWRREFINSLAPIGANPFEMTIAYKDRVWFDDLDYNIHLSNSSYAKILDIARMRAFLTWFPHILESGARLGLGASHFHFLKEIPLGAEYEIRLNIVGWEEKWTHVVAQFVTYPKGRRSSSSKASKPERPALTRGSTSATLVNEDTNDDQTNHLGLENMSFTSQSMDFSLSSSSIHSASSPDSEDDDRTVFSPDSERARSTSSTSVTSSSSSPHHDAKLLLTAAADKLARSIDAAEAKAAAAEKSQSQSQAPINPLPPLPEGAVLHCMHVSSYCFKQGRITIPPRVALVASGFGDTKRWHRVQEIRDSKSERSREAASTPPPAQHTPPANAFSFHEEGTVPEASESAAEKKLNAEKVPRSGRRGGLKEILTGGWKRYEKEGLWNMDEFEERRRAGVEKFAPLRHSLLSLF